MKKLDLGQTIQIAANIGVIAGIIFLGIELRQNNELLNAEARVSRVDMSLGLMSEVLQSPQVAEVIAADSGQEVDKVLSDYYFTSVLVRWEYSWREVQLGALEEDRLPVLGWIGFSETYPGFVDHWNSSRAGYHAGFREFMDTNVIVNTAAQ